LRKEGKGISKEINHGQDSEIYVYVNRFMGLVDKTYNNPEQRNNISIWEELLTDKHLDDPETREILLYRTFYFFLEKLESHSQLELSPPVANAVIRLFADKFEWVNEETSLINRFGSGQINFVFRFAYGEPVEPQHAPASDGDRRRGEYLYPLFRLLIVMTVLSLFTFYMLKNYTGGRVKSDVPYYACKILFSENAKRKDYSGCQAMAESGDDKAQLLFGLAQLYSRKFTKQPDAVFDWLSRSAEQSNSKAMYMLGALRGEDLKIDNKVLQYADFESAEYWLDRAAVAGEKYAYIHLASLYVIRSNNSEDLRLAREKLIIAANAEQADAYFAMALFELYGLSSKVDYELARKWLDLYAISSVPEGSNDAAWLLATSPDGKFRDAGQAAQYIQYLQKDTKDPNLYMYIDTVAAVDAANGKFDAAVDYQQQAINLLKRQDKDIYQGNIDSFQERLSRYKNHREWTEALPDNYITVSFEGVKNRIYSRELRDIVLKTH